MHANAPVLYMDTLARLPSNRFDISASPSA